MYVCIVLLVKRKYKWNVSENIRMRSFCREMEK